MQKFLTGQPSYPEETSTDTFYLGIARDLLHIWNESGLMTEYPESVRIRTAVCMAGYYQDVIADAGLWRSFINECRRMYGRTLPFFDVSEDYIDYELNPEDIRFLLWYCSAMVYEDKRMANPASKQIEALAAKMYDYLESAYEEAPMPADFNPAHELELYDPADREALIRLGSWLFLHAYLLTPAFALSLSEIVGDPKPDASAEEISALIHQAMTEQPTGPLALYVNEWIALMVNGKLPAPRPKREEPEEHPYYAPFTKATQGSLIAYFDDYESMNRFFVEALGWEKGVNHLEALRNEHDFTLLVNRYKGMLVARNVARCIADPANPFYDKGYAREHAFELLTVRGLCPADLLHFIMEKGWLPDAHFPESDDTEIVAENWDFIARCYLQLYYRGD